MKHLTWTKSIVTAIALCLFISTLAGCGGKQGGSTGVNNSKVVNNCHVESFPIAKEKVTLKVMVRDYTGSSNYDDISFVKAYEEKTNVHIDWEVVINENVQEKMLLNYMTNNLPDIAMGVAPYSLFQQWKFFQQGMVTCLEPYLETYGKNILAAYNDYDMARYNATMPDGRIWTIPLISNKNNVDSYFDRYFINTTWLENLGLSMPTTTKELHDVLVAFRDGDPNGNGQKDEIPMAICTDLLSSAFSPFGISNAAYEYRLQVGDDYKLEYTPVTEAYKKALGYYAGLFNEGLLDNKWNQRSAQDVIDLVNSPTEKVGMFGGWGIDWVGSIDVERQWADYQYLPPINDGDTQWKSMAQIHETSWPEWFVVTSNCKYPEIAVRWADFLFTPEGVMWASYGAPDEKGAWHINEDGNYVVTLDNCPAGMTQAQWLNTLTPGHPLPGGLSDEAYAELEAKTVKKPESQWTTYEKVYNRDVVESAQVYAKLLPENIFPRLNYEVEADQSFMTEKAVHIYGLSDAYRRAVLAGTTKLESSWDQYVKQTYERGLEEFLRIQQTAYDKYRQTVAGFHAK